MFHLKKFLLSVLLVVAVTLSVVPAAASSNTAKPYATLSSTSVDPGETLCVKLRGTEDASGVRVENPFGFNVRFTKAGKNLLIGFLPVSYHTAAGTYTVSVLGDRLRDGGAVFTVQVSDKQFDLQELIVDEQVAGSTIFNDAASKEFRQKIWPLKEIYDDEKYFDGPFRRPMDGEYTVTTPFGFLRTVNGKPNPRHDGIDWSAGTGTPVYAAQNGRVLFADFVQLTGNTIVVEHGCGLKSWYEHLSEINVEAGAMVKTGDLIGKVGATGFATGPHLHFSASINGVYINPLTLTDSSFLAFGSAAKTSRKEQPVTSPRP